MKAPKKIRLLFEVEGKEPMEIVFESAVDWDFGISYQSLPEYEPGNPSPYGFRYTGKTNVDLFVREF